VVFENHGHHILHVKEKREHLIFCISDGVEGALVPEELETCTSGKAPSMLKGRNGF